MRKIALVIAALAGLVACTTTLKPVSDFDIEIDYDTILNPSGITLDHETWQLSRQ